MKKEIIRRKSSNKTKHLQKRITRLQHMAARYKNKQHECKQKNRELQLLHKLNMAVNRGDKLGKIITLLARETLKIFHCMGATIYLLSEDQKYLILQESHHINPSLNKINRLPGITVLKPIKVSLKKGGYYYRAIENGKPLLIDKPKGVMQLISEFTEQRLSKKRIAQIFSILNTAAVIIIPLIAEGKIIGVMDVGKEEPFSEADFLRFLRIAEQFTMILSNWQAKQRLDDSEELYRHIAEDSIDGVAMAQEGRIIYVNDAYCRIFGYSQAELIGKTIVMVVAPEDRTLIKQRSEKRVKGKTVPNRYEFKGMKKNGTCVYVEVSTSRAFIYHGKPTILAILRDITERKNLEDAIRISEERFREFMQSANDGFILFDEHLNIIDVNKYIVDTFDWPREQAIGLNIADISLDAWESGRYLNYLKVIETGKPYAVEVIAPPAFGNRNLLLKAFKVGKGLGMIVRDTTSQKRTAKQLHLANERLQYLLSSTEAVVYSAKAWGDFGATYISKNVENLCGFHPGDFLEHSSFWLDHIHPEDIDYVLKEVKKIYDTKYHNYEYRFRCKNGKYKWIRDHMKLILDEKRKPMEIVGYLIDITEEKAGKNKDR